MSNEGSCEKRLVFLRIPVWTCIAVERRYKMQGDKGLSAAFLRALDAATSTVNLSAEDRSRAAKEIKQNFEKRMKKRLAVMKSKRK